LCTWIYCKKNSEVKKKVITIIGKQNLSKENLNRKVDLGIRVRGKEGDDEFETLRWKLGYVVELEATFIK